MQAGHGMRGWLLLAALAAIFLAGCEPVSGPWNPEITFRPRVLYLQEDEPVIRERLGRPPYDAVYARVRQTADLAYRHSDPAGPYDHTNEPYNANIAKAAAFVFAIEGEPSYGRKAADILIHLQPRVDQAPGTNLAASEALTAYCQAFDTLAGAAYDDEGAVAQMEAGLGSLADSLYTRWILENPLLFNYWLNNHQTKVASAIGLAAVTLNQDARATDWIHYGVTVTDLILNRVQAPAGGGYAEGTNYYVYSAVNHLPFMWAFHRFLGGKGEIFSLRIGGPFMRFKLHIPRYYDDFFAEPTVRDTIDWLIRIRMPDGHSPNFDDANLTFRYNGMFANIWDSGVYAWDWLNADAPHWTGGSVDLAADLLSTYDDTIPPREPDWTPTQFMPEAGTAVFRSDWSRDATYLLLLGEHGTARVAGFGHEHPDPTSFILYAKGELLAIDSGYINFEHHRMVNQAKNHNLVLVDGRGPCLIEVAGEILGAGSDAFIEETLQTDFLDHASVRTAYAGVEMRRGVIFAGRDHFFIYDDLVGRVRHTYDWLLHGNALEDFDLEEAGGVWRRGGARLTARVTSTRGAPQMSSYEDVHATGWGTWGTHAVLRARVEAVSLKFLSVLYPTAQDEDPPLIRAVPVEGEQTLVAVHAGDGLELAFAQEAEAVVSFTAEMTGTEAVATDAVVFFLKTGSAGSALAQCFLKEASSLTYGGERVFSSPSRMDIALRFAQTFIDGYVRAAGPGLLQIRTGAAPLSVSGSGVTGHGYLGDGMTEIEISGPSSLAVVLP